MRGDAMADELYGVTKKAWKDYEYIRQGARINMNSSYVHALAGITREQHGAILKHYSEMAEKWKDTP
ncbi:hypothetical protein LCGC14_0819900 [marine sediment metagenome]|uniref:Uncharacterized protein n=1 Tax=marine sediment metagenome TaxID=412755 RepID=A0A0F9S4A8_9ZZZZ